MNRSMAALSKLRSMAGGEGMGPSDEEMTSPMVNDESGNPNEFFLNRDLFSKVKVKEGQEVWLKGRISSLGSRIGFVADTVKPAGDGSEPKEAGYDADLNDEMGEEIPKEIGAF